MTEEKVKHLWEYNNDDDEKDSFTRHEEDNVSFTRHTDIVDTWKEYLECFSHIKKIYKWDWVSNKVWRKIEESILDIITYNEDGTVGSSYLKDDQDMLCLVSTNHIAKIPVTKSMEKEIREYLVTKGVVF